MIPVEQTKIGGPDHPSEEQGNCMQACIASIFEVPLDEAPVSVPTSTLWYLPIERWMEARGYAVIWDQKWYVPNGFGMKSVKSFRGKYLHTVVSFGREIVWDPSNDRDEGEREDPDSGPSYTYFLKLDPALSLPIHESSR